MRKSSFKICPFCRNQEWVQVFEYTSPPAGETRFEFLNYEQYYREVYQCQICRHYLSVHDIDLNQFYSQEYVDSTYGERGLIEEFERINRLDPQKSDNIGRVQRILSFISENLKGSSENKRLPKLLDVGSGLGVFPYRMKEAGWDCMVVDVDPRAVAHAREVVKVEGVCGNLLELEKLGKFDLIAFNKVLEHIEDPVSMLSKSREFLNESGIVYVELPDGEGAAKSGPEREEFFIEHHHVFSVASLALLANRAGFLVFQMERLQEPSTKYTLRGFLGC